MEEADPCTVFVRNLSFDTTHQELENHFTDVGPVKRAFVVTERGTKNCRGFGYVQFVTEDDAQQAIQQLNNKVFKGRKINVALSQKRQVSRSHKRPVDNGPNDLPNQPQPQDKPKAAKPADTPTQAPSAPAPPNKRANSKQHPAAHERSTKRNRLIIRNLPFKCGESDVKEMLGDLGPLAHMTIPRKDDGSCRGFAFLEFVKRGDALNALGKVNKASIMGRTLTAQWAVAKDRFTAQLHTDALVASHAHDLAPDDALSPKVKRPRNNDAAALQQNKAPTDKAAEGAAGAVLGETASSEAVQGKEKGKKDRAKHEQDKDAHSPPTDVSDSAREHSSYEHGKQESKTKGKGKGQTGSEGEGHDRQQGRRQNEDAQARAGGTRRQRISSKPTSAPSALPPTAEHTRAVGEDDAEAAEDVQEEEEEAEEGRSPEAEDEDAPHTDAPEHTHAHRSCKAGAEQTAKREEFALFVRNLPFDATEDDIKKKFEQFGRVRLCLIVKDRDTARSRGTAFVHFYDKEAVEAALVAGRREERPAHGRSAAEGGVVLHGRTLLLDWAVSRDDAKRLTADAAPMREAKQDRRNLHLLNEGRILRGSAAADGLTERDIHMREASYADKKAKLKNPFFFVSLTRLSFRNLPATLDEKGLRRLIQTTVTHTGNPRPVLNQVKLVRDANRLDSQKRGKSKGFGFVEMANHADALRVLRGLNNNPDVFGPSKRPIVEFAVEDRRAVEKHERAVQRGRLAQQKVAGQHDRSTATTAHDAHVSNKHIRKGKRKRNQSDRGAQSVEDGKGVASVSGAAVQDKRRLNGSDGASASGAPPHKKQRRDTATAAGIPKAVKCSHANAATPPRKAVETRTSNGSSSRAQGEAHATTPTPAEQRGRGQAKTVSDKGRRTAGNKGGRIEREEQQFDKMVQEYKRKLFAA